MMDTQVKKQMLIIYGGLGLRVNKNLPWISNLNSETQNHAI